MAEFIIREAGAEDVRALARLHVKAFRETHGWLGSPGYALRLAQWESAFAPPERDWFCLVVESEQGEMVGFAKGQPYRLDDLPYQGELNKIYLLRRFQGQGLGRRLVSEAAKRFLEGGTGSMLLFGDAHSRSNGFYEHLGAERLYSPSGEFHGGYGWKCLDSLVRP